MFSFRQTYAVDEAIVSNLLDKLDIVAFNKLNKDYKDGQDFILNALGIPDTQENKNKKLFKVLHMAASLMSNNYELKYKLFFKKKPTLIDFYCLNLILNGQIRSSNLVIKKLKKIRHELLFIYSHVNALFELKEIVKSKYETFTQIVILNNFISSIVEINYNENKSVNNQIARQLLYKLSQQLRNPNDQSDQIVYMLFENLLLQKNIIGVPYSYEESINCRGQTYILMEQLFYEENREKDKIWLDYNHKKQGLFKSAQYLSSDILIYLPCFLNFDNCSNAMQDRLLQIMDKIKKSEIGQFYMSRGAEINDNYLLMNEQSISSRKL